MEYIIFQDQQYPIRDVDHKVFGDVIIGTTELSDKLMTEEGDYTSEEARVVDEMIFFYVDSPTLQLSRSKFIKVLEDEVCM